MKKLLVILACAAVAGQAAFAAEIWSEDFAYPQGTTLTAIGGWTGASGNYWTGNSENLIMRAPHATGGWTFVNRAESTASLRTFSLDLRSDATFSGNSYLRLAMSAASQNVVLVDFNGGFENGQTVQTGGYDHFDVIVNNTGSAQAIEGLGGTIAAASFAVYKNGSATPTASGAVTKDFDGIGLWMNGGSDAVSSPPEVMYTDNWVLRDNAYAIPEPATFGLLGLASAGLFVARRFRMI